MKTLNLEKVRNEFLMLTLFHGERFCDEIDKLNLDTETKKGFQNLVQDFLKDLFDLAEFDPCKETNSTFKEEIIKS